MIVPFCTSRFPISNYMVPSPDESNSNYDTTTGYGAVTYGDMGKECNL
jgi:hypothetical protein